MKESTKITLSVFLGLFILLTLFSLVSMFVAIRAAGLPKEFALLATRLLPLVTTACLLLCGILVLVGVWTGSKALRCAGYVFFILSSLIYLAYNVYTLIFFKGNVETVSYLRAFGLNLLGILCGVLLIVSLKVRSKLLIFFIALAFLAYLVVNYMSVEFGTGVQLVGTIIGIVVTVLLYLALTVDAAARSGKKAAPAGEAT